MPTATEKNIRALKITSILTGIYFVIELGIGIYTGSIAVLSDSFHTFSAVGGVLLALAAGRIAMKPADLSKTFGYKRAEVIGALLNGIFLLAMAGVVFYMGFMRLQMPMHLPPVPMLVAAFGGLITEVIAIKLLYSGQKGDLNIKGAFWHVLQTFVGSVIIIIAAVVIHFTGCPHVCINRYRSRFTQDPVSDGTKRCRFGKSKGVPRSNTRSKECPSHTCLEHNTKCKRIFYSYSYR
jgi:cobalt-zinc-cadmium efflux system protein